MVRFLSFSALLLSSAVPQLLAQTPAVALMANHLATDPPTTEAFLARFDQTVAAGSTYLVGNATWAELEPSAGQYQLDGLRYLAYVAGNHNMRLSFTLRIIDGHTKGIPAYLGNRSWSDPVLRRRLKALLDVIVGILGSRAEWFSLGYEINPYFQERPSEIQAYATMFADAKAHLRKLQPTIQVSTALIFFNLGDLFGSLAPLNSQLDFLVVTYIPLRPGWRVWDPSVVPSDMDNIKKAAGSRKILLLEVAYPSSPSTGSSLANQAAFYRAVFQELKRDPSHFAAVAFMMLGDLSGPAAANWAYYYGIADPVFKELFQTLGVFDESGAAKPAWTEFLNGVTSLRN